MIDPTLFARKWDVAFSSLYSPPLPSPNARLDDSRAPFASSTIFFFFLDRSPTPLPRLALTPDTPQEREAPAP